MTSTPTPVGQSAADLDPRLKRPDEIEDREREKVEHLDRPVTVPGGVTPVGAAAADQAGFPGRPRASGAPAPSPTAPAPTDRVSAGTSPGTAVETNPRQRIGNLAILARQAIGNQWPTMEVNPQKIADVCQIADESLTASELAAAELDMLRSEMRTAKTALRAGPGIQEVVAPVPLFGHSRGSRHADVILGLGSDGPASPDPEDPEAPSESGNNPNP